MEQEKQQHITYVYVNGDQHYYPNATHVTNYNYGNAKPEQTAQESEVEQHANDNRDKLSAYIKPEHYNAVVGLAGVCESRADITKFVCSYIHENKLMKETDLSSKKFVEALIPHLIKFKGAKTFDNLRRVMFFP